MDEDESVADAAFVEAITPDVMRVLESVGLFSKLDDLMCGGRLCAGNYALTLTLLEPSSFPSQDVDEVLAVLQANGGHCDCEVLYNVALESRLRREYWSSRHLIDGRS